MSSMDESFKRFSSDCAVLRKEMAQDMNRDAKQDTCSRRELTACIRVDGRRAHGAM